MTDETVTEETSKPEVVAQKQPLPWTMISVLIVTAIVTGLGMFNPAVLGALERMPGTLTQGEWWRLVTALFVHDQGWSQIIFNAASLIVVGTAMDRLVGSWRWLVLYFVGGVVGELVGYWWQPIGAGNSVACAGLMGGLFYLMLQGDKRIDAMPALYSLYFVAILTGQAMSGTWGAVILSIIAGTGFWLLLSRFQTLERMAPWLAGMGLLYAVGLTLLRDIHGPPVLAGAGLAVLIARKVATRMTLT